MDSKGDESLVDEVKRMTTRVFKKLKKDLKNNSMNPKRIQIKKKKKKTQK
jgi:hypothetical protein